MKKGLLLLIILAFISCKEKPKFELEILTKEINYLDVEDYKDYTFGEKDAPKESQTIITYKLTNNTDDSYYFNVSDMNNKSDTDYYIQIDKAFITFIDKNNKHLYVRRRALELRSTAEFSEYLDYDLLQINSGNFVIHPHETIFFEWFVVLPFGTFLEDTKYYAKLDKKEKYYGELILYSDGANYKRTVSRTDLKTIEENGYKVFNGTIKAKNKVPVVFKPLKE